MKYRISAVINLLASMVVFFQTSLWIINFTGEGWFPGNIAIFSFAIISVMNIFFAGMLLLLCSRTRKKDGESAIRMHIYFLLNLIFGTPIVLFVGYVLFSMTV